MRQSLLCAILLSVIVIAGCSRRDAEPEVVDVAPPPPPPSAWIATDSQSVADELVPLLLKRTWIADFKQRTGQVPKVALGPITDRSQGSMDLEVYRGELRRALSAGGTIQVVDARENADFLLKGSVGANDGVDGAIPVRRYQIDLVIIERTTGDVATPSLSIERQKDDRVPEEKPLTAPEKNP